MYNKRCRFVECEAMARLRVLSFKEPSNAKVLYKLNWRVTNDDRPPSDTSKGRARLHAVIKRLT